MKSKLTLTPFVNEFSCGFKVCSNNKPFAQIHKLGDDVWELSYVVRFPKYLGVDDERISKKISYTRKVIEIMAHISSIKDEQVAKYKSEIEMYHTNRLKSQLNRYEKFSDVATVVSGDVESISSLLF